MRLPRSPRTGLPTLLHFVAIVLLVVALAPIARAQETEWIRQFGSSDRDQALAISVHAPGIYVAGWTWDTLPGQTSAGYVGTKIAFSRVPDAEEFWG